MVGRLAVGTLLAGRCYRRLARVPSVLGVHNTRDYAYNLAWSKDVGLSPINQEGHEALRVP